MGEARVSPEDLALARGSLAEGGSVSFSLYLGPDFHPATAPAVVLVCSDGLVEWYVPEAIKYSGKNPLWRGLLSAPSAHRARLLWKDVDFSDGLRDLSAELDGERQPRPGGGRGLVLAHLAALDPVLAKTASRLPTPTRGERFRADVAAVLAALRSGIFAQDHALPALATMATRHRYRKVQRRPEVAALVGKTGTGKTATVERLAEALAKLYPREGWYYSRIDCGSFVNRHETTRLVGAPPGYVGHGQPSLADTIAAHPKTVLLLDEAEKAPDSIFQILLGILDQGRVPRANSADATADATGCIVLLTSNIAADTLSRSLDAANAWNDPAASMATCRQALASGGLRPELIGRVGQILPYRPLTDDLRRDIVRSVVQRVGADFGVEIDHVDDAVLTAITDENLGVQLGARPDVFAAEALLCEALLEVDDDSGPVAVLAGPPIHCVPMAERIARKSC